MRGLRVLLLPTGVFLAVLFSSWVDVPNSGPDSDAVVGPPGGGLSVQVLPDPAADSKKGSRTVLIRFHNAGSVPIGILKPVDGSVNRWHMPYYRFTIKDDAGRALKLRGRCGLSGLWAETRWPQDYLVEIAPGASFEIEESLLYCDIQREGPHSVSFEYVYEPTNERFAPPPRAWRGSVKAPEVVLNLTRK